MTTSADPNIPAPPQTGRTPTEGVCEEPIGLWAQLLTAFRDLSGVFDAFANDAHPDVRALGRAARARRLPQANDYFVIGDLCARLTAQGLTLSQTYAAKTVAAYSRAGEVSSRELPAARRAILAFAFWIADAARVLGNYESLETALLICEQARRLIAGAGLGDDERRLQMTEDRLREQVTRMFESESVATDKRANAERESRRLCDQGQVLLRQGRPQEALDRFEAALAASDANQSAWLWRAMALTDLGRFDDALASYDRALALEPESAGVWNNKGSLLMELGRLNAALECFERAIDLAAPVSTVKAVYWLNRGKVLYMLGRYAEARDALVHSHELDPSSESAAGIAACRERLEGSAGS
ncbi:tetratricopeptide repeat protein [Roseiflexus sp.]|uniref:tetratricopeptide repeat protein n=1 Tax=Roseiflexus sp. TaxID=2562120 RepID=UPI00398AF7BD